MRLLQSEESFQEDISFFYTYIFLNIAVSFSCRINVGFGVVDAKRVMFMVLFAESESHRTKNGLVPL